MRHCQSSPLRPPALAGASCAHRECCFGTRARRLTLADVYLDTLAYNGHTTGSDALWASVPMVTLRGNTWASRVGASLAEAVECPEMIVDRRWLGSLPGHPWATHARALAPNGCCEPLATGLAAVPSRRAGAVPSLPCCSVGALPPPCFWPACSEVLR